MKPLGWLIHAAFIIFLAAQCNSASAQVTSQNPPTTSDQWQSHQMNQPPPDNSDKYSASKDRLEEIRQLYLQAKQELEKKAVKKPGDAK
jgi:hypothetical protein